MINIDSMNITQVRHTLDEPTVILSMTYMLLNFRHIPYPPLQTFIIPDDHTTAHIVPDPKARLFRQDVLALVDMWLGSRK